MKTSFFCEELMNTKKDIFLSTDLSAKNMAATEEHNFLLTRREAIAASPADMAVCGEEDPGEALELLVRGNIPPKP